jgi:hypothetical protein
MYVFQLFDYYAASRIVLVMTFFECVVVAYIYGMFPEKGILLSIKFTLPTLPKIPQFE